MSHTRYKPVPEGCDNQGRYTTRDTVVARYRNGQPIAAEPCNDEWVPLSEAEAARAWAVLFAPLVLLLLVAVCAIYWSEITAFIKSFGG